MRRLLQSNMYGVGGIYNCMYTDLWLTRDFLSDFQMRFLYTNIFSHEYGYLRAIAPTVMKVFDSYSLRKLHKDYK